SGAIIGDDLSIWVMHNLAWTLARKFGLHPGDGFAYLAMRVVHSNNGPNDALPHQRCRRRAQPLPIVARALIPNFSQLPSKNRQTQQEKQQTDDRQNERYDGLGKIPFRELIS